MVTVIASKEELTTPVNNGVNNTNSNDPERSFQFIKDYQEVDFHRTASCKPLPEDLFGIINGQISKFSIKGTFFLQIDAIEPFIQINNDQNQQTNDNNYLILTLTDGIMTVKAITNDSIPNLTFNTKLGSKLLLTDITQIKNGLLQLTHENTRFQYGSNKFPRPRPGFRDRGNGSYRPSYEGRRNNRYDNEDGDNNFLKRPPPKNTLMDFMTTLKISNVTENEKPKERNDKRRYNNDTNSTNNTNYQSHHTLNNNNNNYNGQIIFHQDGIDEQLDPEDDPSHANYRERRNPLPPRLQRAQEERTRRNTNRFYDDAICGNDINSIYRNDTTSNQSLSSLSYGNETSYIHNNSSTGQQHNSYAQNANMLAGINGSTPTHLAYYPTNSGPLTYNLAGIPNSTFPNQQQLMGHPYPNDHITFCYAPPYGAPTYLPSLNGDTKTDGIIHPDNETTISTGCQNDENNDSGIKSESSSTEQKQTSPPPPPTTNDSDTNLQNEKHRDSNSNQRIRWKIGDMCLARWSEDGEFYLATITEIQPPYCIVLFRDYNNYDQVHFGNLKMVPRDQQFYPFIPPLSDINMLAANGYFPPRTNYYPSSIDGYLIMPEAPPFPFNSAGTLYMYPPPITSITRINRSNTNGSQQLTKRNENVDSVLDSSSPPSKDSNDTSAIDSTTTSSSSNDDNQQHDLSVSRPCSIADAPLTLVTSDDSRERSTSTESVTSSKDDEQQLTKEEEEEEKPRE
ncbi:unnamed protein product [Adineta steineri]|uniref:Tudor domain-containing protein n=1 Tax=Adineta steineri TaxID=433720 RepID=A0A818WLF8_9BILA|nr:unnamed protein product [Adineta steineri]